MKHVKQVKAVRHELSDYNALKIKKVTSKTYRAFLKAYETNFRSKKAIELAYATNKEFKNFLVPDEKCGLADPTHTLTKKMTRRLKKGGLPDVIYVSPYLRTMETYETMVAVWPELKFVRMVSDPRVQERSYGKVANNVDWRVYFTLNPEQKEIFDAFGEHAAYRYSYPGGESIHGVKQRVASFLNSIHREYPGKKVLIVTHTLIVMVLRLIIEELSIDDFIKMDKKDKPVNNGITIFKKDPGQHRLSLLSYNK